MEMPMDKDKILVLHFHACSFIYSCVKEILI